MTRAGCTHKPVNVTKAGDHGVNLACFRWVNAVLGNFKTAAVGTLKSVRRHYVFRYLAEFQYRFNRRFDMKSMFSRLASACANANAVPRPYASVRDVYEAGKSGIFVAKRSRRATCAHYRAKFLWIDRRALLAGRDLQLYRSPWHIDPLSGDQEASSKQ